MIWIDLFGTPDTVVQYLDFLRGFWWMIFDFCVCVCFYMFFASISRLDLFVS